MEFFFIVVIEKRRSEEIALNNETRERAFPFKYLNSFYQNAIQHFQRQFSQTADVTLNAFYLFGIHKKL